MSQVFRPGRGNKRRVRGLHWKREELVSFGMLLAVLALVSVGIALWLMAHPMDG